MKLTAQVKSVDNSAKIFEALKELQKLEVLVGIPEDKAPRKKGTISNAELLYIHTNGSPKNNIPPRPVIEPAITDSKKQISKLMKETTDYALKGDKSGMNKTAEKAGMLGANAAKSWFTNPKNNWAPNATVTIEGSKPDKNGNKFIKGKRKSEKDTKFTPLIDTAQMQKSITYAVRKKG